MSIEYPPSVHAGPILANEKGGTHWPMQSEYVWEAFSAELKAEWGRMVEQESAQQIIKSNLEGQTSAGMIPGINRMVAKRDATLADRIAALAVASPAADSVRASIVNLKSDLYWIVMTADQKIKELESKAGIGAAAMLPTEIAAIIAAAHLEAEAADDARAAEVTAKTTELLSWSPHGSAKQSGGAATPLSTGMGQGAASPPLSPGAGSTIKPTDYTTMKDGVDNTTDRSSDKLQPTTNSGKTDQTMKSDEARNSAKIEPAAATTTNPGKPSPSHSSPPVSSAPSSGGSPASSAGSPSSMIGQMMPRSMSSSPAASSSPASAGSGLSSGGGPASASPAAAHAGGPGSPAGAGAPGGGAGAGAAPGSASGVRPAGLAGVGSGISESSARFASGAVNSTANALGAAGNIGSQVAQGAASAASAASPAAPAAAPPVAASAPVSGAPVGGAPIGMMPAAAAGGPGAVAPVTGGAPAVGGGPAATPAAAATQASSVVGATPAASGSALAPVPLNTSPGVRGVGADGATGDALFEQAADVGRDVITALLAQTKGYMPIDYAVSVMYEHGGQVSAWLATSEGASYIPLGVRIPPDVKLSVTDPVIGRTLWESSAKAGGANPLDVVVRQAQEREMAAPGSRVLAIASSLPMDQVMDWAAEVSARPVAVDPKSITKPAAVDMAMAHRCAVAMPWEWNQANRFDESERRRVAARHGYMAMTAGGLTSGPCEEVVELFDAGQPIPESLWHEVATARMKPLTEYMLQMQSAGHGGADPARALAAARAAEVVLCLRHSTTAEGCADLLYATRLAGAPLSQTAAVT